MSGTHFAGLADNVGGRPPPDWFRDNEVHGARQHGPAVGPVAECPVARGSYLRRRGGPCGA